MIDYGSLDELEGLLTRLRRGVTRASPGGFDARSLKTL
jgi:hypothetical protein